MKLRDPSPPPAATYYRRTLVEILTTATGFADGLADAAGIEHELAAGPGVVHAPRRPGVRGQPNHAERDAEGRPRRGLLAGLELRRARGFAGARLAGGAKDPLLDAAIAQIGDRLN